MDFCDRRASCYNWSNPEEAREKLEGKSSRALTEVAPIGFNGGGTNWFPNPTHEMRQRLREHTKPTVGATKQGKWSPGGVITPRKQATQIGKGELHLNVGDAFTTGCPQNPKKRFSVELLTSIFHSIKRGEALQQPWNYTEEETFWSETIRQKR
ncbi:unnamed protein product [Brassica oleracea var. botrytis]|uniref:(rape) hypothetical protein n=1 Tax=Brassica napus TaxID=3708 RepID=A0A816IZF6_BRANA|nr:unnamed protein product [Brassica napus]